MVVKRTHRAFRNWKLCEIIYLTTQYNSKGIACIQYIGYMWCDLAGSVGTRTCDFFSFLFDWSAHLERYILLKTYLNRSSGPKAMSNWRVLRTIENNRHSFVFFWLYLTINTADFRLIPLGHNTYLEIHSSWHCSLFCLIRSHVNK